MPARPHCSFRASELLVQEPLASYFASAKSSGNLGLSCLTELLSFAGKGDCRPSLASPEDAALVSPCVLCCVEVVLKSPKAGGPKVWEVLADVSAHT